MVALLCSLPLFLIPLPERVDRHGDSLRRGALQRLGTPPRWRHAAAIYYVASSSDGQQTISVSTDRVLRIWETDSGKLRGTIALQGEQAYPVVVLSADGRLLAYADSTDMLICTLPDGKGSHVLHHNYTTRCLALSPRGELLAVAHGDGAVGLWDTVSGHLVRLLDRPPVMPTGLVFAPDGNTLYAASSDGSLHQYVTATGKEKAPPQPGEPAAGATLAISPDGKTLALATSGPLSQLLLIDPATGVRRHAQLLPRHYRHDLTFSRDGHFIAVASANANWTDGAVLCYDVVESKSRWEKNMLLSPCGGCTFGTDHKTLFVGIGQRVQRWHLNDDLNAVDDGLAPTHLAAVALAPQGALAASGDSRGLIFLWDNASGKLLRTLGDGKCSLLTVRFVGAGRWVAGVFRIDHNVVEVVWWDTATGKLAGRHQMAGHVVAFSADGKLLATGNGVHGFTVYNLELRREIRRFTSRNKYIVALAISPDGRWLAAVSSSGSMELCSLFTGSSQEFLGFAAPHVGTVQAIQFAPDGLLLLSHSDLDAALWDVQAGQCVAAWKTPSCGLHRLWFTPDGGGLFAQHAARVLEFVDLANQAKVRDFPIQDGPVTCFALDPKGKTLLTGHYGGTAVVWSTAALLAPRDQPRLLCNPKQMAALWHMLGSPDGVVAFQARWKLAAAPGCVPFLRQRLRPIGHSEASKIEKLIQALDSNSYKMREQATYKLQNMGESPDGFLRAALANNPTLEVRWRVEKILERLESGSLTAATLQALRAITVLETVSGAEAREVVQVLADGAPGARVTVAAQAALDRMK